MSPVTPPKSTTLSLLSPPSSSSPTRLPIRQKGSLTIPPLPQLNLPPLPEITNPAIRRLALTHSSNHPLERSRKRDLIYREEEKVLDNEKLEHVGDALLTAAIVTLLHEIYPAFGPGPATYLRSHMVSNRSLAQIAEQYNLPELFIAEAHSKYMIQAAQKAKGSLFEAYVAGVYYSFLMPRDDEPEVVSSSSSSSPKSERESEGSGETVKPARGSGEGTPNPTPTPPPDDERPEREVGAGGPSFTDTSAEVETPDIKKAKHDSESDPNLRKSSTLSSTEPDQVDQEVKATVFSEPDVITRVKPALGALADLSLDELFSHGLKAVPSPRPAPAAPMVQAESMTVEPDTPGETTPGTGINTSIEVEVESAPIGGPSCSPYTTAQPITIVPAPRGPTGPSRRTHGQAFDHLCTWLYPLFTPIAQFLSSYLESESSLPLSDLPTTTHTKQNIPNAWKEEDTLAAGGIGALNQFLGKNYGCGYLPEWSMKKRVMDVWRMVCLVRTPEGVECRAEGKRLTKKAAMTVAAYKVWQQLKEHEEVQAELRRKEEEEEEEGSEEEQPVMIKISRVGGEGEKRVGGEDGKKEKEMEEGGGRKWSSWRREAREVMVGQVRAY